MVWPMLKILQISQIQPKMFPTTNAHPYSRIISLPSADKSSTINRCIYRSRRLMQFESSCAKARKLKKNNYVMYMCILENSFYICNELLSFICVSVTQGYRGPGLRTRR